MEDNSQLTQRPGQIFICRLNADNMSCACHSFITWEPHLVNFCVVLGLFVCTWMTEDWILHSVSEPQHFFGRLNGQSKVSALPRAHLEEVMNLQSNSPLMYFVIERGSSPPSNWNYLSKYFELFSGHSCHCMAHGDNYRLMKMKDTSKIVLILLAFKRGRNWGDSGL